MEDRNQRARGAAELPRVGIYLVRETNQVVEVMATQSAASLDPILLSAWNRNYRTGLLVIVAGIVVLAVVVPFSFWANSTGHYPASFGAGLAIYLIATAGFMLIVLGGSWVYTNRRLLQLSRRNARPLP